MKVEEIICDQCGARKNKANHWHRVYSGRQGFHLYKSEAELSDDEHKDYCSDNCVMIAISEFMHPPKKSEDYVDEIINDLESRLPQ